MFIILTILLLTILYIAISYNKLITLRGITKEAWSQIDIRLQERNDLIPNLVNVVKGYAKHEEKTFEPEY